MDFLIELMRNNFVMGTIIAIIFSIMFITLSNKFDLISAKFYTKFNEIKSHGKLAIVTNNEYCTKIGLDILKKGGSVADAAIASLLCEGISNPHSMGIGGGFLLTIYNKMNGIAEVLNARESAPIAATKNMFGKRGNNDLAIGGLSTAVPGELKGYWLLHSKYGKMKWNDLFQPAIDMCLNGIQVSENTANMIAKVEEKIINSPTLKDIFINEQTGKLYKKGEYMKRPQLAKTLELVAINGPDALYSGILTESFVEDIRINGGIITEEDLFKYQPKWQKALVSDIPDDLSVLTVPSPGSGEMILTVLDVISNSLKMDPITFWHRVVEAIKYAFGIRTLLTGPKIVDDETNFVYTKTLATQIRQSIDDGATYNETVHYFANFGATSDSGTCHLSILGSNGDGIAVTSTINSNLGAMFASKSTGIILNNEMMDFAIPHHHPWKLNPANYIEPLKQPMSSMCPTIVINKRDKSIRLIIGAAGGPKIITSTLQVIIRNLWLKQNIISAIRAKRLHHQLQPMLLEYEDGFSKYILEGLAEKGHNLIRLDTNATVQNVINMPIYSTVNAISIENDIIYAVGDARRGASGGTF